MEDIFNLLMKYEGLIDHAVQQKRQQYQNVLDSPKLSLQVLRLCVRSMFERRPVNNKILSQVSSANTPANNTVVSKQSEPVADISTVIEKSSVVDADIQMKDVPSITNSTEQQGQPTTIEKPTLPSEAEVPKDERIWSVSVSGSLLPLPLEQTEPEENPLERDESTDMGLARPRRHSWSLTHPIILPNSNTVKNSIESTASNFSTCFDKIRVELLSPSTEDEIIEWILRTEPELNLDDKAEEEQEGSDDEEGTVEGGDRITINTAEKPDENATIVDVKVIDDSKSNEKHEFNGVVITRPYRGPVRVTLKLTHRFIPSRFLVEPPLAALINTKVGSMEQIVGRLWQYIRVNKLQSNADRRVIKCNSALFEIFGESEIQIAKLQKLISNHVNQMPPSVIEYFIDKVPDPLEPDPDAEADSIEYGSEQYYDVLVEAIDPRSTVVPDMFMKRTEDSEQIGNVKAKVQTLIDTVKASKTKQKFMNEFSKNPMDTIHKLIESQTRDLKIIQEARNPVQEERSYFYNEPWLIDAVREYMAKDEKK